MPEKRGLLETVDKITMFGMKDCEPDHNGREADKITMFGMKDCEPDHDAREEGFIGSCRQDHDA
ncbi:hypothetical protein CHS0354_007035 [Potamilus streckersoni]|uniref:Uncharacterized protein n=1 Tax=Potamilus streckersoni TaxID=2493646 RepID=A0AAE0SBX8_9BIVA|nr:hypothetical protein CHS0354_007035 [Potamilus streckersoni]